MSKPPTLDRKSLRTPDAFVERGTLLLGKLSRSKIGLMPILLVMGLLVIGFYAYDQWDERQEQKAWTQYYQATKSDVKEKWDKLKQVQSQFPKSRAAMLASVDLGDYFFDQSKLEWGKDKTKVEAQAKEAVDWYSKALTFSKLLPIEKQLLLINRGNSNELLGKWDDSTSDYEKAFAITGSGKGLALLSLGRAQELQGSTDKAVQTFEKVFTEFASSEYAKNAKIQWRRLKTPLLQVVKTK